MPALCVGLTDLPDMRGRASPLEAGNGVSPRFASKTIWIKGMLTL